ncbi:MAG TPA: protein kinase [Anaerolineae bacterium]|nr:protein kinase [Anaerolineae bacterium]
MNLLGQTIGNYQIRDELGRGGMAVVYRAYQPSLNRYVAIKVLPPQLTWDAQFVERFKREARAAAGLRHPNIVVIHDVGQEGDIHYIVMEYLEGLTLKDLIDREGPLPAQRAARIVEQVGAALDYAHQRGFVHRDVKPANIFVGEGDRVTLTDFGIAKAAAEAEQLTRTGALMGTPEYMSPEQAIGEGVDHRTDLYALGVALYQMLVGQVPFHGTTPHAVLHNVIYESPPPPRRLNPAISPAVEGVVLKAIAKEPDRRFQRGAHLTRALRDAMAAPEAAYQPPPAPTMIGSRAAPSPARDSGPAAATRHRAQRPAPARQPEAQRSPLPWILAGIAGILVLVVAGLVLLLGGDRGATEGTPAPGSGVDVSTPGDVAEVTPPAEQTPVPPATEAIETPAPPPDTVAVETSAPPADTAVPEPPAPPVLIDPAAGTELAARSVFAWEYPEGAPGPGNAFQVLIWPAEEGDVENPPGAAEITREQAQEIDLDAVLEQPGEYFWSVVVVREGDGQRLSAKAPPRSFVYAPPGPEPAPEARFGRLAFSSGRDGNPEIYVVDLASGELRRLTANGEDDWLPDWSPDGGRIAFTRGRGGRYDLWVMTAGGGEQAPLITTGAWDEYARWAPDGQRLSFSSTANTEGRDNSEVFVRHPDGNVEQITFSPAENQWADWSPDGHVVYAEGFQDQQNWNIYIANADGSGRMAWLDGPEGDVQPTWSPDGGRIAFLRLAYDTNGNGRLDFEDAGDVWVGQADGRDVRQLTRGVWAATPAWSPDGNWIAFALFHDPNGNGRADPDEPVDIMAVPAGGGDIVELVTSPHRDGNPSWTW